MKPTQYLYQDEQRGFTLVEILVTLIIGMVLLLGLSRFFIATRQAHALTNAQSAVQNEENAISALVTPIVRAAGAMGCLSASATVQSSGSPAKGAALPKAALRSLLSMTAGGPPPLGPIPQTSNVFTSGVFGYASQLTLPNSIYQLEASPSIDKTSNDWSPVLDNSFVAGNGMVQKGSDVLVVLGTAPGAAPVSVQQVSAGVLTLQATTGLTSAADGTFPYAAITDCNQGATFLVTGVSGNTVNFAPGSSGLVNSGDLSGLPPGMIGVQPLSGIFQVVALQQNALFIGNGQNGTMPNTLMQATFSTNGWKLKPLVPNVDMMKVLYGVSTGQGVQYQTADQVNADNFGTGMSPWANVVSIKIAFLFEGLRGSQDAQLATQTSYLFKDMSQFNFGFKAPAADLKTRFVYTMTIGLRDASS